MASVGAVRPSAGFRNDTSTSGDAGHLPNQMSNMSIRDDQDPEDIVVNVNVTEPGHIIVTSIEGRNGQEKQTISYMAEGVVGHGSFGTVFQANCLETGETVAIKKVLQDKRYKNRELQTMQALDHPNDARGRFSRSPSARERSTWSPAEGASACEKGGDIYVDDRASR